VFNVSTKEKFSVVGRNPILVVLVVVVVVVVVVVAEPLTHTLQHVMSFRGHIKSSNTWMQS